MKAIYIPLIILSVIFIGCTKDSGSDIGGGPNVGGESGKAGSMAKFTISGDNLFIINKHQLKVFDISDPSQLNHTSTLEVNYGIETVFSLNNHLFIGAEDGMYIYDIADANNILYLSRYEHIQSCDPVVANDTLAFITLNSQSSCRWQNGANQLDVIDISNMVYPQLISSLNMQNPKGLGIDSTHVFVCDGSNGVKIFDFSNPSYLQEISGISGIDAYDVIINNKRLYLIGETGLFQYNFENIHQIELLSNILF